eukprot:47406-Eustigmatos_ZCMA.PRE.1
MGRSVAVPGQDAQGRKGKRQEGRRGDDAPVNGRGVSRSKALFIQMEYCEQTLRGLIDKGELCR